MEDRAKSHNFVLYSRAIEYLESPVSKVKRKEGSFGGRKIQRGWLSASYSGRDEMHAPSFEMRIAVPQSNGGLSGCQAEIISISVPGSAFCRDRWVIFITS